MKSNDRYEHVEFTVSLGRKKHYVATSSPCGAANIIFRTLDIRELVADRIGQTEDYIVRSRKPGELRSVVVRRVV